MKDMTNCPKDNKLITEAYQSVLEDRNPYENIPKGLEQGRRHTIRMEHRQGVYEDLLVEITGAPGFVYGAGPGALTYKVIKRVDAGTSGPAHEDEELRASWMRQDVSMHEESMRMEHFMKLVLSHPNTGIDPASLSNDASPGSLHQAWDQYTATLPDQSE